MNCLQCGSPLLPTQPVCQVCGTATATAPATATIDTARFQLLRQMFDAAMQVPPEHRPQWLQQACGGDAILYGQMAELLNRHSEQTTVAHTEANAAFIGPYRLLKELGRGGMGVVFLALRDDGAFQKQVALKLLLRDQVTPDFVGRFRNERQVLASLDHPHIARILDGGDAPDGMPYYVMEFVDGMPIDRYCEDRKLSLAARLRLFQQVCHAVDYLHRCQVLHRDLKPGNILVSMDGTVKLLDFGIAKSMQAGVNPDLTTAQSGAPMTPLYASPEQITGANLQPSSDVYSLGVIAYKLITGHTPFHNVDQKLAQILGGAEPPAPSDNIREDMLNIPETTNQLRRRMIGDLDQIILMALRRQPLHRYQTAAALADDVQRFLDGQTVLASPGSLTSRLSKALRRNAIAVGVAAVFFLMLLVGGGVGFRLYRQAQEAEARFVAMRGLLDNLEKTGPEAKTEDIARLRQTLETEFTRAIAAKPKATEERKQILERSAAYLEKLSPQIATRPEMAEEAAAVYQQLGAVQESAADMAAAKLNYKRAADLLLSLPDDRRRLASVERRLAYLEQRLGTQQPKPPAAEAAVAPTPVLTSPAAPPAKEPEAAPQPPAAVAAVAPPVVRQEPKLDPREVSELETQLVSTLAKVETAESNIAPVKQRLEQQGYSLHPSVIDSMASMKASVARAKRQFGTGDLAGARESLAAADAFATRVLKASGR